jgi:hypothetical protein
MEIGHAAVAVGVTQVIAFVSFLTFRPNRNLFQPRLPRCGQIVTHQFGCLAIPFTRPQPRVVPLRSSDRQILPQPRNQVLRQRQDVRAAVFGIAGLHAHGGGIAVQVERLGRQAGELLGTQAREGRQSINDGPVGSPLPPAPSYPVYPNLPPEYPPPNAQTPVQPGQGLLYLLLTLLGGNFLATIALGAARLWEARAKTTPSQVDDVLSGLVRQLLEQRLNQQQTPRPVGPA